MKFILPIVQKYDTIKPGQQGDYWIERSFYRDRLPTKTKSPTLFSSGKKGVSKTYIPPDAYFNETTELKQGLNLSRTYPEEL